MADTPSVHAIERASLRDLRAHPRNYRSHPDDQRDHLVASIRDHGLYRNVVVANDGTILAGHGVVEAARASGLDAIPVVRLAIGPDDPQAHRILAGDNEVARLAEVDDRALSELLRDIRDVDLDGLLGTGYDERMLANLVFVTRSEDEIGDRNDADAWVGLPTFVAPTDAPRLIVNFDSEEQRQSFLQLIEVDAIAQRNRATWSIWWPARPREDVAALRFTDDADD